MSGTQQPGRDVLETPEGIVIYPPLPGDDSGAWRAYWYEPDGRRRFCRAASEEAMAKKLEPVKVRLRFESALTEEPGSALVAYYLSAGRHPAGKQWSPSHLSKQRSYCEKYILPVIGHVRCDKIRVAHMQQAVNLPNTPDGGRRVAKTIGSMVRLGIQAGYLTNPRLAKVHWQTGECEVAQSSTVAPIAGQSSAFISPDQIPGHSSIATLASAMAQKRLAPWWYELMPYAAAYSGMRIGEMLALEVGDVAALQRTINVAWQVIEVDGKLLRVRPKGGKVRTTVYPALTPTGYGLAEAMKRRAQEAIDEQGEGTNPHGLMFPAPRGGHFWPSNFDNRVAMPAYRRAGWRDADSAGTWTWHSLRHVFCTTALTEWRLSLADVAALAGHTSGRITLETYLGSPVGTLSRAFQKTRDEPVLSGDDR